MSQLPFIVSLPTQSRTTAFELYRHGIRPETAGEPDESDIPEPPQRNLDDHGRARGAAHWPDAQHSGMAIRALRHAGGG